jgi:hypothetical protein
VAERRDRAPACTAKRGVAMPHSHLSGTLGEKILSVIAVIMLLAISVAVLMSLQYIHVYL